MHLQVKLQVTSQITYLEANKQQPSERLKYLESYD